MGEPNPQKLLAGMDRKQLKWWRAAFAVVPLDDGWRQTDEICRAIFEMSERLFCAQTGTKLDPKNFAKPGDYIPKQRRPARGKIQIDQASIDAHERQTRSYGNDRTTRR